jgi:hypothetical protein
MIAGDHGPRGVQPRWPLGHLGRKSGFFKNFEINSRHYLQLSSYRCGTWRAKFAGLLRRRREGMAAGLALTSCWRKEPVAP